MSAFIIKRLLWGIPTLLVIFLFCFFLLNSSPEKAVGTYMSNNLEGVKLLENAKEYEYYYVQTVKKLELDKPAFYFTLSNVARPPFIDTIAYLPQRRLAETLVEKTGDGKLVVDYFSTLQSLLRQANKLDEKEFNQKTELLTELFKAKTDISYSAQLDSLSRKINQAQIKKELADLINIQQKITEKRPNSALLIPTLKWNGADNRFHKLLTRIFSAKENISLIDSRPVWKKIRESLTFTLSINLLAFILSVVVSYNLAIYLSLNSKRRGARIASSLMFVLYTMPVFWVGSMLLMFFSSSTYGSWLNWFPPGGVGDISMSSGMFETIGIRLRHYLLPVICISYPLIVFLTTHLRDGILESAGQQWAVTARAKGLQESVTIRKHVVMNAIFPYISLLGNMIPSLFAGSVIIEVLFNIPGIGRLAYQSIISRDFPVLFNVILISGFVTVAAQILTDVVYASLDPRIKSGR